MIDGDPSEREAAELADCLDALAAGEAPEAVLARYPGQAAALRPLLLAASGLVALRLEPEAGAQAAARAAFLGQAAGVPPPSVAGREGPGTGHRGGAPWRVALGPWLAGGLAVAALAALATLMVFRPPGPPALPGGFGTTPGGPTVAGSPRPAMGGSPADRTAGATPSP